MEVPENEARGEPQCLGQLHGRTVLTLSPRLLPLWEPHSAGGDPEARGKARRAHRRGEDLIRVDLGGFWRREALEVRDWRGDLQLTCGIGLEVVQRGMCE